MYQGAKHRASCSLWLFVQGFGIFVTMVLSILKALGVIDWPSLAILLPIAIPAMLFISITGVSLVVVLGLMILSKILKRFGV
jgi:hypothetical protein